jgi:RNA polymerase sigma-70 factor (ECF subfamily)
MEELFLEILARNKDKLYRICTLYSDQEEAKDLFQEVLLNIWRSLPSFQNKSSINTWVFRITINVCLRFKYSVDRKKKMFVKLEGISLANIPESTFNHAHDSSFAELYNCIKRLEEIDKSIVLLYLEELPYKEIADITGLSENHIAVKIKRIKEKLFNCLTKTLC